MKQIPNDSLSNEKIDIKTEDIYVDDNYTGNFNFFQHLLLTIENILN